MVARLSEFAAVPDSDREGTHLGAEVLAQTAVQALCPRVIAVGGREAVVGLAVGQPGSRGRRVAVLSLRKRKIGTPYSRRQRNDQAPKARKMSAVTAR